MDGVEGGWAPADRSMHAQLRQPDLECLTAGQPGDGSVLAGGNARAPERILRRRLHTKAVTPGLRLVEVELQLVGWRRGHPRLQLGEPGAEPGRQLLALGARGRGIGRRIRQRPQPVQRLVALEGRLHVGIQRPRWVCLVDQAGHPADGGNKARPRGLRRLVAPGRRCGRRRELRLRLQNGARRRSRLGGQAGEGIRASQQAQACQSAGETAAHLFHSAPAARCFLPNAPHGASPL